MTKRQDTYWSCPLLTSSVSATEDTRSSSTFPRAWDRMSTAAECVEPWRLIEFIDSIVSPGSTWPVSTGDPWRYANVSGRDAEWESNGYRPERAAADCRWTFDTIIGSLCSDPPCGEEWVGLLASDSVALNIAESSGSINVRLTVTETPRLLLLSVSSFTSLGVLRSELDTPTGRVSSPCLWQLSVSDYETGYQPGKA